MGLGINTPTSCCTSYTTIFAPRRGTSCCGPDRCIAGSGSLSLIAVYLTLTLVPSSSILGIRFHCCILIIQTLFNTSLTHSIGSSLRELGLQNKLEF